MTVQTFELTLDLAQVLRSQGGDPARARPALRRVVAEMTERARPMLAPAVTYEIMDVQGIRHDRVMLSPRTSLRSPTLASALGGAQQLVVAICTIGPQLEEATHALLSAGQAVEATVLDGIGSAAVEELAERACELFEDIAREGGLKTSAPFNPGAADWPLEAQRDVFDLVAAKEIGVQLTDSLLMLPQKSLSLVVGLGEHIQAGGEPCDYCSLKEVCRYRERKT